MTLKQKPWIVYKWESKGNVQKVHLAFWRISWKKVLFNFQKMQFSLKVGHAGAMLSRLHKVAVTTEL